MTEQVNVLCLLQLLPDVRLHKALQHRTAVVVTCQQEQPLCYIKTADHNNNNNSSSSNNDISTISIPKIVVL